MCEIDGRVIVITGAAGNLGVATAKLFASRGARLVLLDRDDGRVREALEDIAKSDKHRVVAVDVTDEGSVRSAVASAEKTLGPAQAPGTQPRKSDPQRHTGRKLRGEVGNRPACLRRWGAPCGGWGKGLDL